MSSMSELDAEIRGLNAPIMPRGYTREAWWYDHLTALERDAHALLERIDGITTYEFERGGEREQREALRVILARVHQAIITP